MEAGFGKVLGLKMKIESHIQNGDHKRVRDYLLQIAIVYPNLADCPLDVETLKRAMDFLRANGYQKFIDPKRGVVFVSPSGNSYGSLETKKDEAFWSSFFNL